MLMKECPYISIDGGNLAICHHSGYDVKALAITLGLSISTIRRKAKELNGFKINKKWYFTQCQVLEFIPFENIDIELKETVIKFKAKKRIHQKASWYLKKIHYYFDKEEMPNQIDSYYRKVEATKKRLFCRVNTIAKEEIEEINSIMKNELVAKDLVNKDIDFRQLGPILSSSNGGYTKNNQKNYNCKDPFDLIFVSFRNEYRSGIGWRAIRQSFRIKKGEKCEICDNTENLHVHHLVDKKVNDDNCLQLLCGSCHGKVHKKIIKNQLVRD